MPIKFDSSALRYRGDGGRFIGRAAVSRALDAARAEVKGRLARLAADLTEGRINLAQFALSARDEIKALHVLSAGIGRGGKARLTASELGRVGAETRQQYAYLNRLVRQIASGEQPLTAGLTRRLTMYADNSRKTFSQAERAMYGEIGGEERNVLNASESCAECEAEAARGWVPVGELSAVGSRTCMSNCLCDVELRKAA